MGRRNEINVLAGLVDDAARAFEVAAEEIKAVALRVQRHDRKRAGRLEDISARLSAHAHALRAQIGDLDLPSTSLLGWLGARHAVVAGFMLGAVATGALEETGARLAYGADQAVGSVNVAADLSREISVEVQRIEIIVETDQGEALTDEAGKVLTTENGEPLVTEGHHEIEVGGIGLDDTDLAHLTDEQRQMIVQDWVNRHPDVLDRLIEDGLALVEGDGTASDPRE